MLIDIGWCKAVYAAYLDGRPDRSRYVVYRFSTRVKVAKINRNSTCPSES